MSRHTVSAGPGENFIMAAARRIEKELNLVKADKRTKRGRHLMEARRHLQAFRKLLEAENGFETHEEKAV